jgi:hypothetical protein
MAGGCAMRILGVRRAGEDIAAAARPFGIA